MAFYNFIISKINLTHCLQFATVLSSRIKNIQLSEVPSTKKKYYKQIFRVMSLTVGLQLVVS